MSRDVEAERHFAQKRAEKERFVGLEEDEADSWLSEHDPTLRARVQVAHESNQETKKRPNGTSGPHRPPRTADAFSQPITDCAHVWATIAGIGGELSHHYCLRCRGRRAS